jgi:hypothetical protein
MVMLEFGQLVIASDHFILQDGAQGFSYAAWQGFEPLSDRQRIGFEYNAP